MGGGCVALLRSWSISTIHLEIINIIHHFVSFAFLINNTNFRLWRYELRLFGGISGLRWLRLLLPLQSRMLATTHMVHRRFYHFLDYLIITFINDLYIAGSTNSIIYNF